MNACAVQNHKIHNTSALQVCDENRTINKMWNLKTKILKTFAEHLHTFPTNLCHSALELYPCSKLEIMFPVTITLYKTAKHLFNETHIIRIQNTATASECYQYTDYTMHHVEEQKLY